MRLSIYVRFLSDVLFSYFFHGVFFLNRFEQQMNKDKVVEKSQGTDSKSLHVWNLGEKNAVEIPECFYDTN